MANILTTLAEAMRRRKNTQETINALHKLSDRELKDIGLHRGVIDSVARDVIEVHRAVRDSNNGGLV